ncbi:hypothetical protein ACFLQN_02805 [Candidatus Aenigmatarchaeota archaeon]
MLGRAALLLTALLFLPSCATQANADMGVKKAKASIGAASKYIPNGFGASKIPIVNGSGEVETPYFIVSAYGLTGEDYSEAGGLLSIPIPITDDVTFTPVIGHYVYDGVPVPYSADAGGTLKWETPIGLPLTLKLFGARDFSRVGGNYFKLSASAKDSMNVLGGIEVSGDNTIGYNDDFFRDPEREDRTGLTFNQTTGSVTRGLGKGFSVTASATWSEPLASDFDRHVFGDVGITYSFEPVEKSNNEK